MGITMSKNEQPLDWPDLSQPRKTKKISRREKAAGVPREDIMRVFDEWVRWCKSSRGPRPALNEERIVTIGAAIADYGVETCINAVVGCSYSDWHMGQNPQGKKYNDIELIFRNAQNIERFAGMGSDRRAAGGFLDED